MSSIRYPGSKYRLRHVILNRFPSEYVHGALFGSSRAIYVEPFFGSGAIGWEVLAGLREGTRVVLNDVDYWLMCLWASVKDAPDELILKIKAAQLSAALFAEYKASDGDRSFDPAEAGFRKLLLHQMSFSGLGSKAGGPIGGKTQASSKYTIDARWNIVEQIEKVRLRHILLTGFNSELRCQDFETTIKDTDSKNTLFYLDPPYVDKGSDLYKHPFTDADHKRLAEILKKIEGRFVLSYDDHPLIRHFYAEFKIAEASATYSICTSRKNRELLIQNYE